MQRGVKATARAAQEVMARHLAGMRPWMVTLTYREVSAWAPLHISRYMNAVTLWAKRQGVELVYLWVAELQQRGAVHYHVVLWLPRALTLPKADKRGWWKHGSTRTERAQKPMSYLMKYASKGTDARVFPLGLRLSGFGGLSKAARKVRAWLCVPGWLVGRVNSVFQSFVRAPGGVWQSLETGLEFRSPWEFAGLKRFEGRSGPQCSLFLWRGCGDDAGSQPLLDAAEGTVPMPNRG